MMTTKTYKYKVGLACMRLQPFHTGHQRIIDRMLEECELCYIFIGSANENGTTRNPIRYLDRKRLIENFYCDSWGEGHLIIKPAIDINDLPRWSSYIVSMIPEIVEAYYSGTEEDAFPFTEFPPENYPKLDTVILGRAELPQYISATKIRELFNKDNPTWKLFIPKGNVDITERILKGMHPFPDLEELEKEMGGELE